MKKKKHILAQSKLIDLLALIVYEALIGIAAVLLHFHYLQSTLFFFFIPALFLIFRKTKKLKHIFIASFGSIAAMFVLDFFATLNKAWYFPQDQLTIPIRIFGVVPMDDIIWFIGWVLLITTFYEHFFDVTRSKKISKHVIYAIGFSIFLLIGLLTTFHIVPQLFAIKYAYLFVAGSFLPFFIFMLFHKPSLIIIYVKLSFFFTPLFLVFELTSLMNHHWLFPGFYIGHVELFGLVMPFEEFFFWIMASSSIILSYYEFFVEE